VNDERKRELLDELMRLTVPPSRKPGDITKEDYIERVREETGEIIGLTTADKRLNALAKSSDEWVTLLVRDGRVKRRVWRKVETNDE
jgi:hypothetical protein